MITQQQKLLAKQLLIASKGQKDLALKAIDEALGQKLPVAIAPKKRQLDTEVIVNISNLNKTYKVGRQKVQALSDVSLQIQRGEFVAITGTSGSGKSTLMHIIGGLDKPTDGQVEVAGHLLGKLSDRKLSIYRNKTIGFIFQFFYLQPFLNLQTNTEVPAMFARTKQKSRSETSAKLLETVGLSDRLNHLPRELSGGQMQRAAIARALQNQPPLLLADEPTGNLDRTNALAIYDLFRNICEKNGTTVIIVTHDLELASKADRIISMQDGKVIA